MKIAASRRASNSARKTKYAKLWIILAFARASHDFSRNPTAKFKRGGAKLLAPRAAL
jgi:hypothetical protein